MKWLFGRYYMLLDDGIYFCFNDLLLDRVILWVVDFLVNFLIFVSSLNLFRMLWIIFGRNG